MSPPSASCTSIHFPFILESLEKKILALAEKLKKFRHLSEHERILYARSLLATPDERWRMSQNFLRSHGLLKPFAKQKSAFKSPE